MFKALHIILAVFFAYIAWIQLNDPDPLFWVSLYALAAVVPALRVINLSRAVNRAVTGVAAGFCLAGIALTFPGGIEYLDHISSESLVQDMSPSKPYIEQARELIGTAVAQAVVVFYWVFFK